MTYTTINDSNFHQFYMPCESEDIRREIKRIRALDENDPRLDELYHELTNCEQAEENDF